MLKIAIDAMGGDNAPEQIVLGALKARDAFPNVNIVLVGNETKIKSYINNSDRIEIMHTDEVITADDDPVRAVRRKKNASMVLAANEVKENRADACISAGNTGALMSTGLFIVGRIDGIDRPALSPTLPTKDGKGFLFLDVGANAENKPEHLLQFALMGSIYVEKVRNISNPTVGLLNIGTEAKKGNDLTKQTYELLEGAPLNFIGNVESRELLNGVADIVVTDGFTGNMTLKTIEGTALSLFSMIKAELMATPKAKVGALLLKKQLSGIKKKLDYSEYGGAGLFGLKAPVIKAHGSSDATAVYNAIRQAKEMVENDVTSTIQKKITEIKNR